MNCRGVQASIQSVTDITVCIRQDSTFIPFSKILLYTNTMPASLHALSLIFIVAYKVIGSDMFILLIQKIWCWEKENPWPKIVQLNNWGSKVRIGFKPDSHVILSIIILTHKRKEIRGGKTVEKETERWRKEFLKQEKNKWNMLASLFS